MRSWRVILVMALAGVVTASVMFAALVAGQAAGQAATALPAAKETAAGPPPAWAYGFVLPVAEEPKAPAGQPAVSDDGSQRHIPGATLSFTLTQVRNGYGPADWFPGDHPPMPGIVQQGRMEAMIQACGLCHYPNGKGRQENAGVAGLPYSYFVQTMADFKNGLRKSSDPRKANTNNMIRFATNMTDGEVKASAIYFSTMKWTPWIRVVETSKVPKTRVQNGMFLKLEGNDTEPLGQRIVESPEDAERTELLRDPHSGFIAYVPVGSIKKGEALALRGGGGKTVACATCHGADLMGLGPVPGIAGKSPSYLVRQLYDMQSGNRHGEWTALMKPVVEKLTSDDMIAIAAYTSSRPVGATTSQAKK
jgi:cytochrome c553